MVDGNKLKAQIVCQGKTIKEVTESIGISKRMWYSKLNKSSFTAKEIYQLINCLDISDPFPIFFADEVTSDVTCANNV